MFEFARPEDLVLEELELALIDAGLQELVEDAGTIYVYGDYTDFGSLAQALEEQKIEVAKSGLQRIPQNPQEFSEEQLTEIEKLLDRIEDDEDVQAVYTNIS